MAQLRRRGRGFLAADDLELALAGLREKEQGEAGDQDDQRDEAGHAGDVARLAGPLADQRQAGGPAERLHERQPGRRRAAVRGREQLGREGAHDDARGGVAEHEAGPRQRQDPARAVVERAGEGGEQGEKEEADAPPADVVSQAPGDDVADDADGAAEDEHQREHAGRPVVHLEREVAGELVHRRLTGGEQASHDRQAEGARRVRTRQADHRPQPAREARRGGIARGVAVKAVGLLDAAAQEGKQQEGDHADGVQRAPAVGQVLDRGEQAGAQAVAAGRERAEHADRPAAVGGGELLGDDDHRHRGGADHEDPRRHLGGDELGGGLGEGGADGADAEAGDGDEEDAAPADAVGERHQEERRHRPELDQGEKAAEVALLQVQVVGDELQRRRQHGIVVLLEEQGERDQAEEAHQARLDVGHAAQERRNPPRVAERRTILGHGADRNGHPGWCPAEKGA